MKKNLIDEVYEAQQYTEGKNIVKNNLYRILYLMVCWYNENGLERLEIRDTIFKWAKINKINIKYSLNNIIDRVLDIDKAKLRSPTIKINKQDIEEINRRFDTNKTKIVALAMLCYAKAYCNKKNEFCISSVGLGAWLHIDRKALRGKYIRQLINYGYLTEIAKPLKSAMWQESYDAQSTKYKLNVKTHNSGENQLINNDIRILFSELFTSVSLKTEDVY